MSDREITLHIGLPKTATTTIQQHLFRNADYLRDLGVDYCPDLCPIGHFSNADSHYAIAVAYCMPKAIHSQPISEKGLGWVLQGVAQLMHHELRQFLRRLLHRACCKRRKFTVGLKQGNGRFQIVRRIGFG